MNPAACEMEQMRATIDPFLQSNPNIRVSTKVASSHSKILRKDFHAVADAVRELTHPRPQDWPSLDERRQIGAAPE